MKHEDGEIRINIRFDDDGEVMDLYSIGGNNVPLNLFCIMLQKMVEAREIYNNEIEEEEK